MPHIAAIDQCFDIVRREFQRHIAICARRRQLALLGLHATASRPRFVQTPIQFDGLGEIGQRARPFARPLAHEAAIDVGLGVESARAVCARPLGTASIKPRSPATDNTNPCTVIRLLLLVCYVFRFNLICPFCL